MKQGFGGFSHNQGSLLNGFNFGSLGLNFQSLQAQITAAILSGNQQQASNLIKQGLQSGNTGAVSQALASASANVSPPACTPIVTLDLSGNLVSWHSAATAACLRMRALTVMAAVQVDASMTHWIFLRDWSPCMYM